jgi:hypothetical protein
MQQLHTLASSGPFLQDNKNIVQLSAMTTCSVAKPLSVIDEVLPPLSCLAGDPGFKELLLLNTFL